MAPNADPKAQVQHSDPSTRSTRPPSLAICLTDQVAGYMKPEHASAKIEGSVTGQHVSEITRCVCERLLLPQEPPRDGAYRSYDDIWECPAGKLPIPPANPDDSDELWAKGVDDLTFGTAYSGPDIIPQFPSHKMPPAPGDKDFSAIKYIYRRFSIDPDGTGDTSIPADPAVSLAMACQHMTSYGMLARGISSSRMSHVGIAASQSTAGLPLFANSNAWFAQQPTQIVGRKDPLPVQPLSNADAHDAAYVTKKIPGYGPGTVYTYNPLKYDTTVLGIVPMDETRSTDGNSTPLMKQGPANRYAMQMQKDAVADNTSVLGKLLGTNETGLGNLQSGDAVAKDAQAKGRDLGTTERTDANGKTYKVPNVVARIGVAMQYEGSHASMVLRTYLPAGAAADAPKMVQLFDSGARTAPYPADYPVVAKLGYQGHLCGEGYTNPIPGSVDNFVGLGVVPPIDASLDLRKFLGDARLVGVARLAILDSTIKEGPEQVIFMSRAIPLWAYRGSSFVRLSIARLAWSLRNTPYRDRLVVHWGVFSPTGHLAKVMWAEGARDKTLSTMIAEAIQSIADDEKLKTKRDVLSVTNDLMCITILASTPEGGVVQTWRDNCNSAGGDGDRSGRATWLFRTPGMPDMAHFQKVQQSYEADMNRALAERHQKVELIKAHMKAESVTYKEHPRLAEFQDLEREHLYAGNIEWFFKDSDASKWAWSPETIDDARKADKDSGWNPKKYDPASEIKEVLAYREWGKAPFSEKHDPTVGPSRDKLDSEFNPLGATIPPLLLDKLRNE
ncbi:MAG: hypothetical protein U0414_19615 [Polyangiaceae bacterium]